MDCKNELKQCGFVVRFLGWLAASVKTQVFFRGSNDYMVFKQGVKGGPIKICCEDRATMFRKRLVFDGPRYPLVVLGYARGTTNELKLIYESFSQHKIRKDGEWFHPAPEIIEFIDKKCFKI